MSGANAWQVHASGIDYFVTRNADPITGDFSLRSFGSVSISVRDTAVWMFPKGIRIDGTVTVHAANPGACLIIVANNVTAAKNARLYLCNIKPFIIKIFEIMRIAKHLSIYETENDALNAIKKG